jgi:phosphopantothenoylcysteine decarboxylase/phosphopantothenate--cysteine ligase
LEGKKIILGITGSIAAYKAAALCRLLLKEKWQVKVLMTTAAQDFISPLTLSTLSKNDVLVDISTEDGWNNHVDLGIWADAMIIAPCTANTLAKLAGGFAGNILTATYLSAKCPVFVAPAMDLDMWKHPSTKRNIEVLEKDGLDFIPVGVGELASGLFGEGRMAEPGDILNHLKDFFVKKNSLTGVKTLITVGPTYEHIDPVRYIGNHSSGKMGWAIALDLAQRGASVTMIKGPTQLSYSHPNISVIQVTSAKEMYDASISAYPNVDVSIFAAAVSDFTPENVSSEKVKKKSGDSKWQVNLTKTKDIAAELGKIKNNNQINIGFALETNNEKVNAQNKLSKKNFDFIVLNSLNDKGAGFGSDTNKVSIFHSEGKVEEFPIKSKKDVACDIVDRLHQYLNLKK